MFKISVGYNRFYALTAKIYRKRSKELKQKFLK